MHTAAALVNQRALCPRSCLFLPVMGATDSPRRPRQSLSSDREQIAVGLRVLATTLLSWRCDASDRATR
jgi:hypothetical protein